MARHLGLAFGLMAGLAVFSSCTTMPNKAVLTPQDRVRREHAIGSEVQARLESALTFKQDSEVSLYLRKMALALSATQPELKSSNVGILLIEEAGKWKSYSIPGNRIYLPVGVLRELDYENEVAALLAMDLAHLLKRHLMIHLSLLEETTPEAASGLPGSFQSTSLQDLFTFTEEMQLEAAEGAVDILYKAGYDPRGLVSLWNRYLAHLDHSPYEPALLDKLLEKTRRVVALYAPLRNPIVRSREFLVIRKRIRKL